MRGLRVVGFRSVNPPCLLDRTFVEAAVLTLPRLGSFLAVQFFRTMDHRCNSMS